MNAAPPRVVIVGGGFGGLSTARRLRPLPVEVTVLDRRNFHLFQPLLYQVATGALSPANIAAPLRAILKRSRNTRVLLEDVTGVDVAGRRVLTASGEFAYNILVVAAGVCRGAMGIAGGVGAQTRAHPPVSSRSRPVDGHSGRTGGLFMRSFRPPRGGSPGHAARGGSPTLALPALLRAAHLLGLALGSALEKLRESGVTAAKMFEKVEEQSLLLRMMRETAGILGERWDKVPERHRPHYVPEQRFRILRIRSLLGLSQRETAEMFRVSTETIARWEMETTSPDADVPRPLVAPNPPVRRFADVVRAVVKTMELAGFGGNDLIARTLARAGWKLSARTVGRIRRERWPVPRLPEVASKVPRAVRARRPNHVWMLDLTDVKGMFGLVTFKVGVVFDAFSRMPLSARVFTKEPSSPEITRFVSRAAKKRGHPAHFVSDRGACFTGGVFRRKLRRLGVKQRFGAIGKKGSIALMERLWRTLKDTLGLRLLRPLVAEDLMEKIELGLVHYAHFRPHQV